MEKPAALIETLGEHSREQNLGKYGGMFGNLPLPSRMSGRIQASGEGLRLRGDGRLAGGMHPAAQAQLAMGGRTGVRGCGVQGADEVHGRRDVRDRGQVRCERFLEDMKKVERASDSRH